MTAREMQIAFDTQIELAIKDYEIEFKPSSHTIFIYLNQAQERLVKTRYSGYNAKGESFEQTQKRTDDLRTLVAEISISTITGLNKPNSFSAALPADYMFAVGEEADITYTNPLTSLEETKRVGITESTSDTYSRQVSDPYSEHILHYEEAHPLRLFLDDDAELIGTTDYTIPTYYLRYLKMPEDIEFSEGVNTDSELPEHMHQEIVDTAVNLFLEAAADPRYQSNKEELGQQE